MQRLVNITSQFNLSKLRKCYPTLSGFVSIFCCPIIDFLVGMSACHAVWLHLISSGTTTKKSNPHTVIMLCTILFRRLPHNSHIQINRHFSRKISIFLAKAKAEPSKWRKCLLICTLIVVFWTNKFDKNRIKK